MGETDLEKEQLRAAVQTLFAKAGFNLKRGDCVTVRIPSSGVTFSDAIVADFGFSPVGDRDEPIIYIARPRRAAGPSDWLITLKNVGEYLEPNAPPQPRDPGKMM